MQRAALAVAERRGRTRRSGVRRPPAASCRQIPARFADKAARACRPARPARSRRHGDGSRCRARAPAHRFRPRRNPARRRTAAKRRQCACAPKRNGRRSAWRAQKGDDIGRRSSAGCPGAVDAAKIAGEWSQDQYGAARHLGRTGFASRPLEQSRKTHRESHRQLAPQGQYRRTRRQALRRSQRRKLPPRQGHPDHPGRHAPDQRRRKGGAALQDDRAGRTRLRGGSRASVSSTRTATASIS